MELINNRKYWSVRLTFLITIIVFAFFNLIQALTIFFLSKKTQIDIDTIAYNNLGMISLISSIIGSFVLFLFIRIKNRTITDYLNLFLPKTSILLSFLFLSFLLMGLMELISDMYPDIFETDFVIESYKQAKSLPLLYLGVGIFGPLFEEFLFRGFLFKGLEKSFIGGHGAVVVSSILFALVHLQYGVWIILLMLFPMALLLGYARLKSGSLLLPILIHILNNTITCLLTHFEVY